MVHILHSSPSARSLVYMLYYLRTSYPSPVLRFLALTFVDRYSDCPVDPDLALGQLTCDYAAMLFSHVLLPMRPSTPLPVARASVDDQTCLLFIVAMSCGRLPFCYS